MFKGSRPGAVGAAPRPKESDLADCFSPTSPPDDAQAPGSLRKFHPLANLFPYVTGSEFQELVEDIRRHGLIEPIVLYEDMILDGRNRYRACLAAKVEPKFRVYAGSDPAAFVVSANIHRRHLRPKQRRDLITALIKAAPEKSNRQIAATVKASHPTVAKVRDELEKRGDVEKVTTSIDSKGRKQPVKRRTEDDFRRDLQTKKAAAAMPGVMPPVIEKEVNLIISAWDAASDTQQQEFVKLRRAEIARIDEQADPFALPLFLDRRLTE